MAILENAFKDQKVSWQSHFSAATSYILNLGYESPQTMLQEAKNCLNLGMVECVFSEEALKQREGKVFIPKSAEDLIEHFKQEVREKELDLGEKFEENVKGQQKFKLGPKDAVKFF